MNSALVTYNWVAFHHVYTTSYETTTIRKVRPLFLSLLCSCWLCLNAESKIYICEWKKKSSEVCFNEFMLVPVVVIWPLLFKYKHYFHLFNSVSAWWSYLNPAKQNKSLIAYASLKSLDPLFQLRFFFLFT